MRLKLIGLLLGMSFSIVAIGQLKNVSGVVTSNEDDTPLIGVNVLIKGSTDGTITDVDGKYQISSLEDAVLVFSYIGYESIEIPVNGRNVIDVTLLPAANQLGEIVVTALGLSRDQTKLGYSVQQLSAEEIKSPGNGNVMNAINGKVAGVQIISSSSAPGSSPNVVIRGLSSLNNNRPLYVIDGVPVSNGNGGGLDYVSYDGTSDINPDEIESLSVLKGAAATALYGSRAQNGAIIITTKDGSKASKGFNIDLSTSYTIDEVTQLPEILFNYDIGSNGFRVSTGGSWGPLLVAGEQWGNNRWGFQSTDVIQPLITDNLERFWDTGTTRRINLGVSGKSDKGNFYTGYTNLDQKGVVPGAEFERNSFSLRGTSFLSDRFTIGGSISFNRSTAHNPQIARGGFLPQLYGITPWLDVRGPHYDINGDRVYRNLWALHPNRVTTENNVNKITNRFIGNINGNYKFSDVVSLGYRLGADYTNSVEDYYREKGLGIFAIDFQNAESGLGGLWEDVRSQLDYNVDVILKITKQINSDLGLSGLVGWNAYSSDFNQVVSSGNSLLLQGFRSLNNVDQENIESFDSNFKIRKFGYYSDWTAYYKNYLSLSGTLRFDQTSTLPAKNRGFWYWSTSAGLTLSELTKLPGAITFAKIRASLATVGNDTGPEATALLSSVGNSFFGNPTATLGNRLVDPDLRNEQTSEWEVGVDLRFFNDKIGLDFAYYNRSTINQIVSAQITGVTGFTSFLTNGGDVRNRGIEAILSFNDINIASGLKWNAGFNFTKNTNEVVEISDQFDDEIVLGSIGFPASTTIVAAVGSPMGVIKGFDFQRDEQGRTLIANNGFPLLTDNQVPLGNMNPDWLLGITNSLSYKGVSLSALLEFKQGGDIVNMTRGEAVYNGKDPITIERYYCDNCNENATRVFEGIVSSTGEVNTTPVRLDRGYYRWIGGNLTSLFVEDASWIRLRDVTLSYRLPKSLIEKLSLQNLEISITGRNIWLDTDYSGVDPEANSFGSSSNILGAVDFYNMPTTKGYTVNLNVQF